MVMIHAFQLLFIDCNYPKAFVWWIGMHAVMFYFLFSRFYKDTYVKPADKKKVKSESTIGKEEQKQKKEQTPKTARKPVNICFPGQDGLYDTEPANGISKSYTSTEGETRLRNNAFVDKKN